MATRIKRRLGQWLEALDLPLTNRQPGVGNKITADLHDVAFDIATAKDINAALPRVLRDVQQTLNATLPSAEQAQIFVLFSCPATAETFLHHGQEQKPSANFIQQLHRTFTQGEDSRKDLIEIQGLEGLCKISARKLSQGENLNIWLLFSFTGQKLSLETLRWRTADIENSLKKGITAWRDREEQIKSALKTERAIYAAELHDSIAQVLGYLRIKSSRLDKLCQQQEYQPLQPIAEELAAYTHCAYRQTRELITSSRLTSQTENLSEGIINSIKEFEQQSAIVFELDNRLAGNPLCPKQSMQILYIARESLSNTVRHSHATHSRITVKLTGGSYFQLVIEDNGTGINAQLARNDSFGLQIMRERAERINASLNVGDRAGGGTRVELALEIGEAHD